MEDGRGNPSPNLLSIIPHLESITKMSDLLGNHERFAVIAFEEEVGQFTVLADVLFLHGVHRQDRAQRDRLFLQVDLVGGQMLEHPVEGVHHLRVVADGGADLVDRRLLT